MNFIKILTISLGTLVSSICVTPTKSACLEDGSREFSVAERVRVVFDERMQLAEDWINWGYHTNPLKCIGQCTPGWIAQLNKFFGISLFYENLPFLKQLTITRAETHVDDLGLDLSYKYLKDPSQEYIKDIMLPMDLSLGHQRIQKEMKILESFVHARKLQKTLHLLQDLRHSLYWMGDFNTALRIERFITMTIKATNVKSVIDVELVNNAGRFLSDLHSKLLDKYYDIPGYIRIDEFLD